MSDTVPRPPGCKCHWEMGDSPCPVHDNEAREGGLREMLREGPVGGPRDHIDVFADPSKLARRWHSGSHSPFWYPGPASECEHCKHKEPPAAPPETKVPGAVHNGIRYHPGTAAATRARDLLLAEIAAAGGRPTHTCIGADGTAVAYFGKAAITFEPDETHSSGGSLYAEACVAVDDKR